MKLSKKNSKKVIVNYILQRCIDNNFSPEIYLNDILKVNGNSIDDVWVSNYSYLLNKEAIQVNRSIINRVIDKIK